MAHEHQALAALIQYLRVSKIKSRSEIADKAKLWLAYTGANPSEANQIAGRKLLDNLLQQGTVNGETEDRLRVYVKEIISTKGFFAQSRPGYVIEIIRSLFPEVALPSSARAQAPDVFARITDDERNEDIKKYYKGVWIGFRYSAHAQGPAVGEEIGKPDPRVVRTAVEITPRDPDNGRLLNGFRVHYRPRELTQSSRPIKDRDYFITDGTIYPVKNGTHAFFIGFEDVTKYPFQMATQMPSGRVSQFAGAFIRKQEYAQLNWGRVILIRANSTMQQQTDLAQVYETESKCCEECSTEIPNIKEVLEAVRMKAKYDGRSAFSI